MTIDTWEGCYKQGWKGFIVPEAFQHPAKGSFSLSERIYEHIEAEGWVKPGDRVVDPFGGIGGFAFHAMLHGLNWTGIELESRFCLLAEQNIALWNKRYSVMPHFGTARILAGDSRNLAQVVGMAEGCVSSPPFGVGDSASAQSVADRNDRSAEWIKNNTGWSTGYGNSPGNLGNMRANGFASAVSSPPFGDQLPSHDNFISPHDSQGRGDVDFSAAYGSTPGQLGAMKPGDVMAAISSPPYAESLTGRDAPSEGDRQHRIAIGRDPDSPGSQNIHGYSSTPSNLGNLPATGFEAAVSSPPYESCRVVDSEAQNGDISAIPEHIDTYGAGSVRRTDDSIDDFWHAARAIVEQVYQVLAPGAHAVWVVKGYVKNKQIVDFPHQWQALCESVGFVTLHEHHAMLVHSNGKQHTIDGGMSEKITERKSFFRRLAEKNGSPKIDYETVLCMVKPGQDGGNVARA